METDSLKAHEDAIERAFVLARAEKPAYGEIYPLLEALFRLQARAKAAIRLEPPAMDAAVVATRRGSGFPLLSRWDFPLDITAAEAMLSELGEHIPPANVPMHTARHRLSQALQAHPGERQALWAGFLHHEMEPWEEWVDVEGMDVGALLFIARSCLRPSVEWVAERLCEAFPVPENWQKGYCPVCGSLPGLLTLEGRGERKASCSWCGTRWGLHRLQCPYCDNRTHESLGYIYIEAESHYRVQYCRLCKHYFKLIDSRELLYPPLIPLEEWTTLHLDLLAQRAGWIQPASPSPVVYKGQVTT